MNINRERIKKNYRYAFDLFCDYIYVMTDESVIFDTYKNMFEIETEYYNLDEKTGKDFTDKVYIELDNMLLYGPLLMFFKEQNIVGLAIDPDVIERAFAEMEEVK